MGADMPMSQWAVAMTFNARKSGGRLVQQLRLSVFDGVDEAQAIGRAYSDFLETVDTDAELAITVAHPINSRSNEDG